MPESTQDVHTSLQDGVATVVMSRAPANALSTGFYEEMTHTLKRLGDDEGVRCLVIRSAWEGIFCAGADRKQLAQHVGDRDHWDEREQRSSGFYTTLKEFPVPVVGAIGGAAVGGGCTIASLCDIRVAAHQASFAIPEIQIGKIGGARHLLRVLPQGKVRELYFTGLPLDAAEAFRLGFVDLLVKGSSLVARAEELAATIAAHDGRALRLSKRALNASEDLSLQSGSVVEMQFSHRLT